MSKVDNIRSVVKQEVYSFFKSNKGDIDKTQMFCSKLIKLEQSKSGRNVNVSNVIVGEITECLLVCIIKHFMDKHKEETKDWMIYKGLYVRDKVSSSVTEIDLVLFTQGTLIVFECKNYLGDKIIVDKGTITRKGKKDFDLYIQHSTHLKAAISQFDGLRDRLSNEFNSYKMVAFLFSSGTIMDNRELSWKKHLPFLGPVGIQKLLESELKNNKVWDLEKTREVLKEIKKLQPSLKKVHNTKMGV